MIHHAHRLWQIAIGLCCCLSLTGQVRVSTVVPKSGRGGEFVKHFDGPNSLVLAPPSGENMHQTYFNVCLERLQTGMLKIKLEHEDINKVPAFAAYKLDDGEWQYTPMQDTAQYSIEIPAGTQRCYFASGVPYTYGDMLRHVADLPGTCTEITPLPRKSLEGRDVPVVRITNRDIPDDDKQLVWILAGQHPYELPGLHTVRFMMDFLTSEEEIARSLRDRCIFYVCPIVNVDASDKGLSGKRIVGRGTHQFPLQDLNWDWNVTLGSSSPVRNTNGGPNAYDNISHPQVKALQELIYKTSQSNPLRFFLDSHSPFPEYCRGNDTCSFHFIDKYLPTSSRTYARSDSYMRRFWDHYKELMGFSPVRLSDDWQGGNSSSTGRRSYAYSYGPGEQFDYERCADYWVDSENALYYRNTLAHPNIFFSLTLETGWYETPAGAAQNMKYWNLYTLYQHAVALCVSMHGLMEPYTVAADGDMIIDITRNKKKFTIKGDWTEVAAQVPNTQMHFKGGMALATNKKGASIRIPIELQSPGLYDIFQWHSPMVKSPFANMPNLVISDPSAQITVFNGEEHFHVFIDQSQPGGAWLPVTTLYLTNEKAQPYIEIIKSNNNGKMLQADAFRLSPSSGPAHIPATAAKN